MGKHTSAYKIPLALLNLRGKKSCDPLFHLALFHFRRILGRRGSWWEKCCECFKMFFYHQSRTKWRSTHVKATLRRVGLVWSDRKWFSNAPSVEVQCMCIAGVFAVICDFKPLRHSAPNLPFEVTFELGWTGLVWMFHSKQTVQTSMRTYSCVMSMHAARFAVFVRTGRVLSITS